MSTVARAETAEQRRRIFAALVSRNRLVAVLRIGLPLLGAAVLAGLVLKVAIAGLAPEFGFANISVDRGALVVEAPTYSGMSADGTGYLITATAARSPIGRTDLIDLTDAVLTLRKPAGAVMTAEAEAANLEIGSQIVRIAGSTRVADGEGMEGTLDQVTADMAEETIIAEGAVDIVFANGATLVAESMAYQAKRATWTFDRATLTLPGLPGAVDDASGGKQR